MNWLVLSFFLTAGLNLHQSVAIQEPDHYAYWEAPDNALTTTLGAELLSMDHLFIAATVRTEEANWENGMFSPFFSAYSFKAGARFGGFEIGYIDECTHPTLTDDQHPTLFYDGWAGFYITFKGSMKLF